MCSDPRPAPGSVLVLLLPLLALSGVLVAAAPEPRPPRPSPTPVRTAPATSVNAFMTQEEALELAFPECAIERQTRYLSKEQREQLTERAGAEFDSSVVYPYRATKKGKWMGTAYFDSHRVRSLRETLMVVVTPDARIGRIEVLAFGEPKDYLPRELWYEQFNGQKLAPELQLNRDIRNVTGATLSGRATVACARRILALHTFLEELARGQGQPAPPATSTAESPRADLPSSGGAP